MNLTQKEKEFLFNFIREEPKTELESSAKRCGFEYSDFILALQNLERFPINRCDLEQIVLNMRIKNGA